MTFDEIKRSDKIILTTQDIGGVLGISPERLREQARKNPEYLGFPVVVACDTVRIPRKPFIDWVQGHGLEDRR